MKTFKNKQFKTRDYEATNVVFCQASNNPDPRTWQEVFSIEIEEMGCYQLYIMDDIRYFGWL